MTRGLVFFALACLALSGRLPAQSLSGAVSPSPWTGGAPGGPTALEPGKAVEREIRRGERHSYTVHADAGQFVGVIAFATGIDVSVALSDPRGKQLLAVDSGHGVCGPEPLSVIAEDSGDLRLGVSASSPDAPAGHYQIQLVELRAAAPTDQTRIKAERAYTEGCSLYARGGAESAVAAAGKWQESAALWQSLNDTDGQAISLFNAGRAFDAAYDTRRAIESYAQALPLMHAMGNREAEATTLNNIGLAYAALGETQKALDSYNQALPIAHATGDRVGEALTLNNIGAVDYALGEKQKALDCFNQVLPVLHAAGNRAGEAKTLNNIGSVYSDLGDKQKALDFFNQALPLAHAAGDRAVEAATRNNMGSLYAALGEMPKALDCFNQALPLIHAVGDRAGEARTLSNIGSVYDDLGEKQKALDYFNQSLPLAHAAGDRSGEATTLNNIGWVYAALGERQKALDYYNRALPLIRAVGEREGEARTLNNIGAVYADLTEKQKALDYYNQALALARAAGDRSGEATTLSNIGWVYDALGEKQKALDTYNQALPLERAVGDRGGEAITLTNIGGVWDDLGEKQKALDYFTQSLPLSRAVQDPLGEASTLAMLMEHWKSLGNPSLAVLFGKEAVDRFQQVRRNIGGLEKEARQSFLKSNEYYYRELAELLVSAGRLPDAQQVLDLLKAQEYSDFTQRRGDAGSATRPVALTPAEEKSNKEYERITGEITAIGEEWNELNAKSARSAEEEQRYNDLSARLTAASQAFQAFLKTLYDSFGKGAQANAQVRTIDEQTAGLQTLIGELGAGTAAIYTLVLDQKCAVMVITPATRVAHEIPIGRLALFNKVDAFTRSLTIPDPEEEIRPKAQDLYNILIAPIEKDLQGAKAQTLVWSLDDVLRYIPLAALYDGKQYLVERFRNVVITTASVGNLKESLQVSGWRGLAMGVSRDYDGKGDLKAVPDELDSVVRSDKTPGSHGPVPGTILLDDSFTVTAMETALGQHFPLVHIASHYVFDVGGDTKSYLLLGGNTAGGQGFHLTLADLRDDPRIDFKGIELLTLSGCQTAVGSNDSDGREIDGLGITAQRKGARAVVATLWAVDDASVGILMETFYRLWITTPGITKAEALRQAQLMLLHGAADAAATGRDSAAVSPVGASKQPPASPYANPHHWAPFLLIGNWK